LLQRRARNQVRLDELSNQSLEGRSKELRRLGRPRGLRARRRHHDNANPWRVPGDFWLPARDQILVAYKWGLSKVDRAQMHTSALAWCFPISRTRSGGRRRQKCCTAGPHRLRENHRAQRRARCSIRLDAKLSQSLALLALANVGAGPAREARSARMCFPLREPFLLRAIGLRAHTSARRVVHDEWTR